MNRIRQENNLPLQFVRGLNKNIVVGTKCSNSCGLYTSCDVSRDCFDDCFSYCVIVYN